jgi:hypothetical protein
MTGRDVALSRSQSVVKSFKRFVAWVNCSSAQQPIFATHRHHTVTISEYASRAELQRKECFGPGVRLPLGSPSGGSVTSQAMDETSVASGQSCRTSAPSGKSSERKALADNCGNFG